MVAPRRNPPLPALSTELGQLLAQARRRTWLSAAQRLEGRGESVYVWQLLNHINRMGQATQRELAQRTAQHPAGVSRLLDEMERLKLVRRRRSSEDRRKVQVELSAKGRALLTAMQPEVQAAAEEALSPLSEDEQLQLRGLLIKLCGPLPSGSGAR